MSHLSLTYLNVLLNVLIKVKTRIYAAPAVKEGQHVMTIGAQPKFTVQSIVLKEMLLVTTKQYL